MSCRCVMYGNNNKGFWKWLERSVRKVLLKKNTEVFYLFIPIHLSPTVLTSLASLLSISVIAPLLLFCTLLPVGGNASQMLVLHLCNCKVPLSVSTDKKLSRQMVYSVSGAPKAPRNKDVKWLVCSGAWPLVVVVDVPWLEHGGSGSSAHLFQFVLEISRTLPGAVGLGKQVGVMMGSRCRHRLIGRRRHGRWFHGLYLLLRVGPRTQAWYVYA